MRIALHPAFVLHTRPYRETSLLVDFFTQEHGRITAVAKGVRQSRSPLRPLLQPFQPIFISWQGKSELVTLITAESRAYQQRLCGDNLLNGLYLNELLMRVLQKQDPHPELFKTYENTIIKLQDSISNLKTLRIFEKRLLENIGYGLQLSHNGSDFLPENYYKYHPESGFEACDATDQLIVFSGKSLRSLAMEELSDPVSLQDAKRLIRLAFSPILGSQKINCRQLYQSKSRDIKQNEVEVE